MTFFWSTVVVSVFRISENVDGADIEGLTLVCWRLGSTIGALAHAFSGGRACASAKWRTGAMALVPWPHGMTFIYTLPELSSNLSSHIANSGVILVHIWKCQRAHGPHR